jgi:beta-glucosidase
LGPADGAGERRRLDEPPDIEMVHPLRYPLCAEEYGDKVKDWIVLNEPFGFTSLGYMLGRHAPGRTGLSNYLPAIHHAALAQAEGGRILRATVPNAHIGTSFSCSEVLPYTNSPEDIQAAKRLDILMNRLFIEPALGRGYPREEFKFLEKLELHNRSWKYTERMQFNFDFIGIQNYFPVVVRYNPLIPIVMASEVRASTRKVPQTSLGWEINPDSFYRILKRLLAIRRRQGDYRQRRAAPPSKMKWSTAPSMTRTGSSITRAICWPCCAQKRKE